MKKRVDELNEMYEPIDRLNLFASWLFWFCAIFSLVLLFVDPKRFGLIHESLSVVFILAAIAHTVISNYNSFVLISNAEKQRRKQLLADSLNVPVTHKQTNLYYNNKLSPSIHRLGGNILENAHFGKSICNEILKSERLKVFIWLLIWVLILSFRGTSIGFVLLVTQVLFSGDVLIHWLRLEFLRTRISNVYETLYSYFQKGPPVDDLFSVANVLDAFVEYECAKAAASIKQSTKTFDRLNPSLTQEWDRIRQVLKI